MSRRALAIASLALLVIGGMAMDVEGRVAVAHPGIGSVWVFGRTGEPVRRIRCCEGMRPTNVAYDGRTLYVTEADSATVQRVELDVPGLPLHSHRD